jgi:hypothetical protein
MKNEDGDFLPTENNARRRRGKSEICRLRVEKKIYIYIYILQIFSPLDLTVTVQHAVHATTPKKSK